MQILTALDSLAPEASVFVYGAGKGGRIVLSALRRRGRHHVAGVADSRRRGDFLGLPLLSPDELVQ